MRNEKLTVLIVDEDTKNVENLRSLLEQNDYLVRTFVSSRALLSAPLPDAPCCAIVEAQMPESTGLQLQSLLLKKRPGLPVIFVSRGGDIPDAVRAMRAGAADFLVKPVEDQKLLEVVERVFAQEEQIRLEAEEPVACRHRFDSLTLREREVCTFVANGKLNKQIAAELGICEKTVKVHRGRVMRKMGVESLAELVRVVVKLDGLLAPALANDRPQRSHQLMFPDLPSPRAVA